MCGILGVASHSPRDEPWLPAACDRLAHRGPDASGFWISDDRRVALGHRRLAIIDLSEGGLQPMADRSGRLRVVLNGEIYNYRELRAELVERGHRFRSASDTEVLLAAYAQWGADCLQRLIGMFAFALYDAGARRLLLARDRAGEKPLFYRRSPGRIAFGSELKALFADATLSRVIDPESLDHYLAYGYVPGSRCLIGGVNKLAPAHALIYDLDSDQERVWRYWEIPYATTGDGMSDEALTDELERLLGDAVGHQLVADVPVGILLSGGLDSSLVTALAATVSPTKVRTYSVVFPGHGIYDESPHARLVAEHFGTEHTELTAEPAAVELLPKLVTQYDEPIGDSSMVPTFLVSEIVRASCTVALGGDGGDELFGGYAHYRRYLKFRQYRRFVPRALKTVMGFVAPTLPVGLRGRNYVHSLTRRDHDGWVDVTAHFDRGTRRALSPLTRSVPAEPPEEYRLAAGGTGSTLQRMLAADFLTYLPDDILVKVDRASMLTSLEVRAPFLDHRVIEFAFGKVPDRLRATTGAQKVLLKRLGRRILPPALPLDRKQGFSIPLEAWFEHGWGDVLGDALLTAPAELFEASAVRRLLHAHRQGYRVAQRIFNLAFLELWRREHRVELPV